jgi:hypothetical protein
MAWLVPAIYVLSSRHVKDVDARHKAGHDESESGGTYLFSSAIRLDVSQRLPPIVCTCE